MAFALAAGFGVVAIDGSNLRFGPSYRHYIT